MGATLSTRVADAAPQRSRGRVVGYWWFVLTAVAIAVFAPLPYLITPLWGSAESSGVAANYADRPLWTQVVFYAHITGGGVALLLSPVQFAARLRRRAPRVHRTVGRVVLLSICLGGTAGLVIAPMSLAGAIGTAGFGLLAVGWVTFAVTAWRAIRRGDVTAHRRWMVRTFAMTYAAVTLRLWLGLMIAVQVAVSGVDGDTAFNRAYLVVPFLSWVPNLVVAELLLRRSPRPADAGPSEAHVRRRAGRARAA